MTEENLFNKQELLVHGHHLFYSHDCLTDSAVIFKLKLHDAHATEFKGQISTSLSNKNDDDATSSRLFSPAQFVNENSLSSVHVFQKMLQSYGNLAIQPKEKYKPAFLARSKHFCLCFMSTMSEEKNT